MCINMGLYEKPESVFMASLDDFRQLYKNDIKQWYQNLVSDSQFTESKIVIILYYFTFGKTFLSEVKHYINKIKFSSR